MEIMGCNIEIKEQNDIEIITLWINSWKEEQYKIIKNYNGLSFKIIKLLHSALFTYINIMYINLPSLQLKI